MESPKSEQGVTAWVLQQMPACAKVSQTEALACQACAAEIQMSFSQLCAVAIWYYF